MSNTRGRLSQLATEYLNLGEEPSFDAKFVDSGVNSINAVAFFKEVDREFDRNMTIGDCLSFRNLSDVADYLDG